MRTTIAAFVLLALMPACSRRARIRYQARYTATAYAAPPSYVVSSGAYAAPAPQPVYAAPAPQPVYAAPAPQPVYAAPAPQPAYATGAQGVVYVTAGQPLHIPMTNIPVSAVQTVVIRSDDGRQFMLTAADIQAISSGAVAVSVPPGVTSGIATVYVNGQQLTIPFRVRVAAAAQPPPAYVVQPGY